MANRILFCFLILLSSLSLAAAEPALKGCAAKKKSIEHQLEYARQYNNLYQVKGLEQALKDNIASCDDAKLTAERKRKVAEKTRKVSEREAELTAVKTSGNKDKIAKKTEKLEKAKQELKDAQDELNR